MKRTLGIIVGCLVLSLIVYMVVLIPAFKDYGFSSDAFLAALMGTLFIVVMGGLLVGLGYLAYRLFFDK